MKTISALALAAVLAVSATAANAYTIKGSVDCPDIIREDGIPEYREMNLWWLLGYFTARNYHEDLDTGYQVDNELIYSTALNYCKANKGNDWDDAAIYTYDQYR